MRRGYWTAVCTHSGQERRAAHHVERQGFKHYLPETLNGRRRERLFPNYLFVFITDRWRCLIGTRGIRRLIMAGEKPTPMPKREIDALKAREKDGIIELPPRFCEGDKVRITHGPFTDCMALFAGDAAADRCMVLIEMLGQQVCMPVDGDDLTAM